MNAKDKAAAAAAAAAATNASGPTTTAKRGRKPANPDETKAEAFTRLGNSRTNKLLKAAKGIGCLATSAYEYTPEQAEKIIAASEAAVARMAKKLRKEKDAVSGGFSL